MARPRERWALPSVAARSTNAATNNQPLLPPEAQATASKRPADAAAGNASTPPLYRNLLQRSHLPFYTGMLLLASVGNTVYFKRMTSAMPNYGWYLTQLSTVIYVPIFLLLAGTGIVTPVTHVKSFDILKKFGMMGIFDGLSGTLMVLGGVHTSGNMQVLLTQAVIPITMFLSIAFIGKRFHIVQHVGALAIVLGIVLAKAGEAGPHLGTSADDPVFNIIFAMSLVPSALSSVFKEVAFRGFDGDLDVNVLQFWVAIFQMITNFIAMPIYNLKVLGAQQVPMSSMPSLTQGGTKCLFWLEDTIVNDCGLPGERECDHCHDAWVSVAGYIFFNILFNICTMEVIKHGSAALSFLVSTLRMPLSAVAFSSTWIMGREAVQTSLGDWISLVVIFCGLGTYRIGGNMLKRQQRKEMDAVSGPLDDVARPPLSASPRDNVLARLFSSPAPTTPGGTVTTASRWRFVPIFHTGTPCPEPILIYVPAPRPTPRSPNRVRHDFYRRLDVASPLHSPRFRDLSPSARTPSSMSPEMSPGAIRRAQDHAAAVKSGKVAVQQPSSDETTGDGEGGDFHMHGLPAN